MLMLKYSFVSPQIVLPARTTVSVNGNLWQVLDTISQRTGLKKGVLIEKAIVFFVKGNREALEALGLSSEEVERIVGSLELSSELTIQETV